MDLLVEGTCMFNGAPFGNSIDLFSQWCIGLQRLRLDILGFRSHLLCVGFLSSICWFFESYVVIIPGTIIRRCCGRIIVAVIEFVGK